MQINKQILPVDAIFYVKQKCLEMMSIYDVYKLDFDRPPCGIY